MPMAGEARQAADATRSSNATRNFETRAERYSAAAGREGAGGGVDESLNTFSRVSRPLLDEYLPDDGRWHTLVLRTTARRAGPSIIQDSIEIREEES